MRNLILLIILVILVILVIFWLKFKKSFGQSSLKVGTEYRFADKSENVLFLEEKVVKTATNFSFRGIPSMQNDKVRFKDQMPFIGIKIEDETSMTKGSIYIAVDKYTLKPVENCSKEI